MLPHALDHTHTLIHKLTNSLPHNRHTPPSSFQFFPPLPRLQCLAELFVRGQDVLSGVVERVITEADTPSTPTRTSTLPDDSPLNPTTTTTHVSPEVSSHGEWCKAFLEKARTTTRKDKRGSKDDGHAVAEREEDIQKNATAPEWWLPALDASTESLRQSICRTLGAEVSYSSVGELEALDRAKHQLQLDLFFLRIEQHAAALVRVLEQLEVNDANADGGQSVKLFVELYRAVASLRQLSGTAPTFVAFG